MRGNKTYLDALSDALRYDPRPVHVPDRPRHRWLAVMDGPEPVVNIVCAVVAALMAAGGIASFLWIAIRHLP